MTDSVLDVLFSIGEFIFTCRLVRWVCLALGLALAFFYRAAIMQDEVISGWVLIGFGIWILFESSLALYDFYNGERGRDFWLSAP
jgi:putative Mn2+ efflux pump MntP